MTSMQPRYGKEEFARRGDAIYERDLRPCVERGNEGKYVAIDIETGAYEIDEDELAASDRLLARVPTATDVAEADRLPLRALHRPPPAVRGAMITGVVTTDREAIIQLEVHGPALQIEVVDAIIDTGFDGWLSLPPALIGQLGLTPVAAPLRCWLMGPRASSTSKTGQ